MTATTTAALTCPITYEGVPGSRWINDQPSNSNIAILTARIDSQSWWLRLDGRRVIDYWYHSGTNKDSGCLRIDNGLET